MKAIINYLRKRRELKLRKWCVDKSTVDHLDLVQAEMVYDWVTKGTFLAYNKTQDKIVV